MATTNKTSSASSAPLNPDEDGSLPMLVHVTAPASLPAGYTFEGEINGDPNKVFTCEVVSNTGSVRFEQRYVVWP